MPLYDYECRSCAWRQEEFRKIEDESPVACEECGGECRRIVSPVPTIGVMPSKPLEVLGGTVLHTNAERREFDAKMEAKGLVPATTESAHFRRHFDRVQNKTDAAARRQGFRDDAHRQEVWKKDRLARESGVKIKTDPIA